jgi:hypothetical protein
MGAKRSGIVDWLHAHPAVKRLVARTVPLTTVQKAIIPKIGFIIKLDANGQITKSYWDTSGEVISEVSEANEYEGQLVIGSIGADRIGVLAL